MIVPPNIRYNDYYLDVGKEQTIQADWVGGDRVI